MAFTIRRSEIHAFSVEYDQFQLDLLSFSLCCVSQDSLLNIKSSIWLLPSSFQVFLKLVVMKMRINFFGQSGLWSSISAVLVRSPFEVLKDTLHFPKKGGGEMCLRLLFLGVRPRLRKVNLILSKDSFLFRIWPHELRALSVLWAYINHTPLFDVL